MPELTMWEWVGTVFILAAFSGLTLFAVAVALGFFSEKDE